jgi:hypothetical protein
VDDLRKKNKRLEQNSSKPTKVSPKAIPSPSKKKVEKPFKEAPKSTTTPATKKKKVWVPKEKSVLTPPGMENPSSSNQ